MTNKLFNSDKKKKRNVEENHFIAKAVKPLSL